MSKVLSQRAVETAKPKAKRYGKPDGIIPNQQLIVHPSGEKSYAILPRIHGKQVKITIGNATVLTLAEARTKGKAILAAIANGEDPRQARAAAIRTASETVEVVARKFIERHAKVHTRRWQETERLITSEILPHLGKRPISSISRSDVIALLDAIVDRGAGVTANRTLTVAKKVFGWAVERDLIETSPLDRVRRPALETPRDRVLTNSELALIWRATDEVDYPIGPFVGILILTGQRRNEVSGMRWSELKSGSDLMDAAARAHQEQHQTSGSTCSLGAIDSRRPAARQRLRLRLYDHRPDLDQQPRQSQTCDRRRGRKPEWRQTDFVVDVSRYPEIRGDLYGSPWRAIAGGRKDPQSHRQQLWRRSRDLSAPRFRRRKACCSGVLGTTPVDA